jgi:hypothetical protein
MLVSVYFMTYGAINFGIKWNIMFVSEYKLGRNLKFMQYTGEINILTGQALKKLYSVCQ